MQHLIKSLNIYQNLKITNATLFLIYRKKPLFLKKTLATKSDQQVTIQNSN